MRLTLGPVLYYWPRTALDEFYEQAATLPVDVVYLGETVCSKRRALRTGEWIELGRALAAAGRQVVISTLTLIEAESELATLNRLCENGEFLVEANDMAAVQAMRERKLPFVGGTALNVYNISALKRLHACGMVRWVPPIEMDGRSLAELLELADAAGLRGTLETEVFVYGRLPLAWSARCFTARAHRLPKDACEFACLNYPQGLALDTQEGEAFLTINGIQTQSSAPCDLLGAWREMRQMGVDLLRISPEWQATEAVVDRYRAALSGEGVVPAQAGSCVGYWYGEAGMTSVGMADA